MTSNDLECLDWLGTALCTSEEGANSRAISSEVVAFTSLNTPLLCLLQFSEAVLSKKGLAVVDGVEVGWGSVESDKDLS